MLLSLVLLAQFFMPAQEQVSSSSTSPIEVLEVEVLMLEVKANRVRPHTTPPPGPVHATDIPGVRPKPDSREQPTINERSRDLREVGSQPVRESVPVRRSEDRYIYYYRVRLKNTTPKKIKSILWEYQLLDGSGSTISQRIFFCNVTIKGESVKELSPGTPSPPSRTVSADKPDDPAQKHRVVVYQIEYSDKSIWMRDGWTQDDMTRVDPTKKVRDLRDNQCALL